MKFSLVQLRAFVTLADCLSFTTAAQRLHVTQPTLSATIHNLEGQVGGRLFDRDTRKVHLTPVGRQCLRAATRVLDEAERASVELREFVTAQRGVVRLAAPPVLFQEFLHAALADFRVCHPGIHLEVRDVKSEDAVALLRRDQVDLAIGLRVEDEPDLRYTVIGEQSLVLVLPARHTLAKRKTLHWKMLENEPLILVQDGGPTGGYVNRQLVEAGIALGSVLRVNQLVTAAGLVQAGFGIGLMSSQSAQHIAASGIAVREVSRPRIARPLCLVTMAGHQPSPAAEALRACIVDHRRAAEPGRR